MLLNNLLFVIATIMGGLSLTIMAKTVPIDKKTSSTKLTVVSVADGDTITVRNHTSGESLRIRFLCIDAPEKSQAPWGERSLDKLREFLPINSDVTLLENKKDVYGRTLSHVINSKGVNVNKRMVEVGMAVHYASQRECNKEFSGLEATAKKAKTGVWSDSKFEMPWDYRKKNGIGLRGEQAKKQQQQQQQQVAGKPKH